MAYDSLNGLQKGVLMGFSEQAFHGRMSDFAKARKTLENLKVPSEEARKILDEAINILTNKNPYKG